MTQPARPGLLTTLIGLVMILAMFVGGVWGLTHLVGLHASLIWTAVVGGVAWLIKLGVEQQKDRRRILAAEKRDQYLQFLDFLNETFSVTGEPEAIRRSDDPAKLRQLRRWSLRLTLIGSDEVVKAFNVLRLGQTKHSSVLSVWGNLWLEMRKDCGHHDTKLTIADVLKSIVNDLDEHPELLKRPDASTERPA
jgi:hypothetical protein